MPDKNLQLFSWGQIEWLYDHQSTSSMSAGIISFFPGKRMNKHIHFGDEQILYVLSGEGQQLIGNRMTTMIPGNIYHIKAGAIHEAVNLGDEIIKGILISIPVNYENELIYKEKVHKLLGDEEPQICILIDDEEIKSMQEKVIFPQDIPITIFDLKENIIMQSKKFPGFCKKTCGIDKNIKNCEIYCRKDQFEHVCYIKSFAYVCKYGLNVFAIPIVFNDKAIGVIKVGHVRTPESDLIASDSIRSTIKAAGSNMVDYEAVQVLPKSRVNAILQLMKKMGEDIVEFSILKNTKLELSNRRKIIGDIINEKIMLEESLKLTQDKFLSTRINNHFLFNVLNALACVAIRENAFDTYNAVISLSKMFRYNLKNCTYFVKLKDEIEYINNYVSLEKFRHENKINIKLDIEDSAKNKTIPFNCLQPIIENSIVHGLKNSESNILINLIAKLKGENLLIEIHDNGKGIKQTELNKLKNKIKNHKMPQELEQINDSGLTMIYSKLNLYYGNNFSFDIKSIPDQETTVIMVLPII